MTSPGTCRQHVACLSCTGVELRPFWSVIGLCPPPRPPCKDFDIHVDQPTASCSFPTVLGLTGWCCCCRFIAKSCLTLLWSNGLQSTRLLCPWDFPGKNTGVGCHFLAQGIFSTQELNLHLLHWQAGYHWAIWEALHPLWVDFQSLSCHSGLGAWIMPFQRYT